MSIQPDPLKCPDQDMQQRRCIVISLIRHAQCASNANQSVWYGDDVPNPLTDAGRLQAKSLGKNWEDTRIDYLLSSPLERALCTANTLSDHNEGRPEVVIHPNLVERRYGAKVARLMRYNDEAAQEALRGQSAYSPEPISRLHRPPEGGESMAMVALRAEGIIRMILSKHGVKLSEAPEFLRDEKTTTTPAILPDGIPHVVIVSHNVFLMELYEKLYSWGEDHVETSCDWKNANWSRHILWYDEDTDKLDVFDMKYCGA
ncbi:Histidine phosphatase superfamily [Amanita muscaria]